MRLLPFVGAAWTAVLALAAPAAADPTLACPGGPDPLRFRPEAAIPGADLAASGPALALAARADESNGREWVAVAWRNAAGEVQVAVSGDGGCSFAAGTGGYPGVVVSSGAASGAPALALRADGGAVRLLVAWTQGGRALARVATAMDGSFGTEVELATGVAGPLVAAIAPPPAPDVMAVAWIADVSGARVAGLRRNAGSGDPATWEPAVDLSDGAGASLGATALLALAADAAGSAGGAAFTLAAGAGSGGVLLRRSDDGGAAFGPWSRVDDATLVAIDGLALGAAALPGGLGPAADAWHALAWSGRTVGAPLADQVHADARLEQAAAVAWDFDRAAGGPSVALDLSCSPVADVALAVLGGVPGASAHALWEDQNEIYAARRPLAQARPNLQGGCGPFRVTGLQPPRLVGGARDPAAAALGDDVVLAFVDDRAGGRAAWLKRADSIPPLPAGLGATAAACGQPPAIALQWASPACDVVQQVVEVGTAPGGTDFTRAAGAASTLALEGLRPGTTYFVRVTATDSAGNVATSEEVSADVPSCSTADLRAARTGLSDACAFGGPGGGNGAADPGENLRLSVSVTNAGSTDAAGATLTPLSRSPFVTVRSSPVPLGDLAAGAAAPATVDLDVSATAPCGTRLEVLLRVDAGGAAWSDLLALDVPGACAPCRSAACAVTADASRTTPTVICRGASLTLDASSSSAASCGGTLLFQWWDGANLVSTAAAPSVSPNTSRSYRLVARCSTDLDCQAETAVAVTVHPRPGVSFREDPPPPHCEGDVVTLVAETSDPAARFAWAGGETTSAISVTSSGVYAVTVTDSNNCSRQDSARVELSPLPPADAGPDLAACGPVAIGAPGFPLLDYAWDPPAGLSDPSAPQPVATAAAPTTWTLTVTDPLTGCSAQDQVTVTPAPAPASIGDFRVRKDPAGLAFAWPPDPLASATRVYLDTDVTVAAQASSRSATALLACEGAASCVAPLPAPALVFFQAVGVCSDGRSEGPN